MAAARKDSTAPQSDFVSRMLQSAAEAPEKKEPNMIKDDPAEIERITKNLKDKWSKRY